MPISLHDTILYYDHVLWYYINYQWRSDWLDVLMPFLRNQWFWVPLYFFLLLFMPSRFGKKGWLWLLGFLLSFIITDQLTASLIKPFVHRLRPCNNPYLTSIIHVLVPCGPGYSFPSSHAANHFSIGIFTAVTLGRKQYWVWPVAVLWALSVAYAQVYVGVHFPLDVLVGGSIGILTGIFTGKVFNRFVMLFPPKLNPDPAPDDNTADV